MRFKNLKRFAKGWLKDREFGDWVVRLARFVGRWLSDKTTANQVTLSGLVACVPMTILFVYDRYFPASVLLTFSLITDFVDGALAHYQQGTCPPMTLEEERKLTWRQRINYRGVTHLGKTLDPLTDKVRFFCVLYSIGIGMVQSWLVIALTAVGVVLTVIRPIKRYYGLGDSAANRFGKYKVLVEVAALCLLVLYRESPLVLNITFVAALTLGLFSLGGHVLGAYVVLRARRSPRRKRKRRGSPQLRVVVTDDDH